MTIAATFRSRRFAFACGEDMFKRLLILFALAMGVIAPGVSSAQVTFGSSTARYLSTSLYSDNLGSFIGGAGFISGTAPAPYSFSFGPDGAGGGNDLYSYSVDSASTSVESTVDGLAGFRFAKGNVTLEGFSFSFLDAIVIEGDLLSQSLAEGQAGAFGASTLTGFTNGTITVLGNEIASGQGEIYNADGLRIVMDNVSLNTGTLFSEVSASVFFIQFTDFAYGGDVLNGSISLAPTTANLRAVPEPATMLVLGGLGLATALRRRRKN